MKAHSLIYTHHATLGMTLVELMVTLAIAATLVGIALFSFTELQLTNRRTSYIQTLHRQVMSARAYAIYHNQFVRICPSIAQQCTDSWQNDIMIFVDENNDRQRNTNEQVLSIISSPSAGDSISYPRTGLSFKPTGMLLGFNNGSFVYCSTDPKLNQPALRITVSQIGRIRLREDSDKCN
ncbi:GspH/FimT family pseudopilin [Pseudoalteromonas sp. T1lg48]|uniref:GspH/FimT family pseudopilin n=1 Tax=Pseudoalteromonas sp. T1lg48 TaxID=2077100 RepID=UPI000CF70047|nr:GspH/FimT family pseudopilin [Pseudoalteromonas sp. T1lg48]